MSDSVAQIQKIVVIEPVSTNYGHLPFNLGLLSVIVRAFPAAQVVRLGDAVQNAKILQAVDPTIRQRCRFVDWRAYADRDTAPWNVFARFLALRRTVATDLADADLIVLTTATGTCITAMQWMTRRKGQRLQVFLHGNLNDLSGWRSRNPLRRAGDLFSSLKRITGQDAQLIVLEEHIVPRAAQQFTWMKPCLRYFPHPGIANEVLDRPRRPQYPLKIGFGGVASPDKGFRQFLQLARTMKLRGNSAVEFHAIGMRHAATAHDDVSMLDTAPAADLIDRDAFLDQIDRLHFLFFWPQGTYYSNAASGVLYDAINRRIPLIFPRTFTHLPTEDDALGIGADSLDEAITALESLNERQYQAYVDALSRYGRKFEENALVAKYHEIVDAR